MSARDRTGIARERRPTLFFLNEIRSFSPVFLDTDVDMTRIQAHRAAAHRAGQSYSTLSYVLHTAARVLAQHPEANAAIRGQHRVARYSSVHGKIALDKTMNGQRAVFTTVLRNLQRADLDEIQRRIDRFRNGSPATMPEFAGVRMLQRLPWPAGSALFRLGVRPLVKRPAAMGTFAVTSLGHRAVDSFFSVGGATITLGLGQTADRPVARDGAVTVARIMRLSLTFDHRVIDGAEAADILTEIKEGLETLEHIPDITHSLRVMDGGLGGGGTAEGRPVNKVGELKDYVEVHARGQRITGYQEVLDRISSDRDGEPGSWTREWSATAEALQARGQHLEASRHYAMARFPYVNGPARQEAQENCIKALDRWRSGRNGIEPIEVNLKEGSLRAWAAGLSAASPRPLLIVMGGIVTIKEQWAPMLARLRSLGLAAIVTEMPATGENSLPYEPESWRMISGLLDAVADRADVSQTHAMALSFSGHLALRCAADDPRIRSVITVGAPVSEFFTDLDWQRRLPQVTVDTLAHMTGRTPDTVAGSLAEWALTPQQLAALDIPVYYTASLRDEIIPPADVQLLRDHVRRLHLIEHDDVHGSPQHVAQTQLWAVSSLYQARGISSPRSALVGLMLNAMQRSGGRAGV